jgi:integrase
VASIQKLGDKWRAQVARKGVRRSAVWDTRREAVQWAERVEREIDAGMIERRTFAAATEHYLATVSQHKDGESSHDWERRKFAAMVEYFGKEAGLSDLTSERLGHWRDHRLKTVSGSTVQREANLLRHLFTLAVNEWRWLEQNPFKGVRLPKHNPPRASTWGWREIRRVLRAERIGKTAEVQAAFRIALHTGMRLAEVLSARVEGKVAVLPKDKTTAGPVKVPLARKGAALLRAHGPFTVGPNEASTLFSKLCRQLLIEGLTFHDARASALTWLSRRVDVMTLSRISRHKDLKILLATYYRETPEQIAERL